MFRCDVCKNAERCSKLSRRFLPNLCKIDVDNFKPVKVLSQSNESEDMSKSNENNFNLQKGVEK